MAIQCCASPQHVQIFSHEVSKFTGTLRTDPQLQRDGEARLVEEGNDGLNRAFLDMLAEDGDVLTLGRGRWLPAPLRLVPLSDTLYVLVGGLPTALLPEPLRQDLRFHGHFRQIARRSPLLLHPIRMISGNSRRRRAGWAHFPRQGPSWSNNSRGKN